ncbi:hypothetical protein GKE82_04530 [Conexibacter sp. W3-3-2]|uniref:Uncharacterized protein n=1 Tax=Paraconexibacter algicola TaxID=2133960 RepID=A0A2T4UDD2_9ACTN|nr:MULTISPECIES: hypothetical protein [Solirubrobacterales]MTD43588.1 hypothetical protein [Conexibacter sp. W3-3-2]PTL55513.1 hypothetical protein C7Y72_17845 [Paraconexibacter algicola]
MAQDGYLDVAWIGGPYDGADLPLPTLYRGAAVVDMPDPATAYADGGLEPAIYTGPTHRYALADEATQLRATFLETSGG